MKLSLSLLLFSGLAFAQTIPVEISINWPPLALVKQNYGPISSKFTFGEVIGCSKGAEPVTFGEGDVIAALRHQGLQAFSRQDAISMVSNSQNASIKNVVFASMKAAVNSTVQAKATGLIQGSNRVGLGIVLASGLIDIALPNVQGVLSLRQVIAYQQNGMQGTMQVAAGRCTAPAYVLFATPAKVPAQGDGQPPPFTIQVQK